MFNSFVQFFHLSFFADSHHQFSSSFASFCLKEVHFSYRHEKDHLLLNFSGKKEKFCCNVSDARGHIGCTWIGAGSFRPGPDGVTHLLQAGGP